MTEEFYDKIVVLDELMVVPFIVKLKGLISKIQKGPGLTAAKSQNISFEIWPKNGETCFLGVLLLQVVQLEAEILLIQALNVEIWRLISTNRIRASMTIRDLACSHQDQSSRGLADTPSQVSTIDASTGSFCQTPYYALQTTFP